MNAPQPHQRMLDLLADRATRDLDPEAEEELRRLEREHPEVDPWRMEHAAAVLHVVAAAGQLEPLPEALRERLASGAGRDEVSAGAAEPRPTPPRAVASEPPASAATDEQRWARGALGWLAAAALLLVLFSTRGGDEPPTAEALRGELLAGATDLLRLRWANTGDPYAGDASGDVVWSDERQEGYMLFEGLPPNDPTQHQYQLWIVDAERSHPQPVDGGVFDAPPGGGAFVVAVDAKLPVGSATTFLVTLESPGGQVVVSDAEHVLTQASR